MKIFRVLFLTLLLVLPFAFCSAQSDMDNYYPKYLNGDRNWILVDYRMDTGQYLNINSVHVDKYNPPFYTITAEYIMADFNHSSDGKGLNWTPYEVHKKWTTVKYNYRYRTLSMDGGQVVIDDPDGPGYITNFSVNLCQSMFWVAYKMPFFKSAYGSNYLPSFDSRFR